MRCIFVSMIICLSLSNCSNNEDTVINTTNPFASSLWDKRIKYLLEENSDGGYDTTKLDSAGNVLEVKSFGSTERYRYNSQRFIERYLYKGDVIENYAIFYRRKGQDTLVQMWLRLPHNNWNYDKTDIDSTNRHTVTFIIDQDGKITQEIDTMRNLVKSYYYDHDLLSRTEEKQIHSNTLSETAVYKYKNSILSKIEIHYRNDLVTESYNCSEGLPVSKTRTLQGYESTSKKIKYIY